MQCFDAEFPLLKLKTYYFCLKLIIYVTRQFSFFFFLRNILTKRTKRFSERGLNLKDSESLSKWFKKPFSIYVFHRKINSPAGRKNALLLIKPFIYDLTVSLLGTLRILFFSPTSTFLGLMSA